jgi:ribonuclease PH
MSRADGRAPDELRTLQIIPNTMPFAEGSASIRLGDTHVLCAATIDERVPSWMRGQGKGWVTAEYSMLPRSTKERTPREAVSGKQGGRTVEIQRLIGRSLRAGVDMKLLGERQVVIDCDVVRADHHGWICRLGNRNQCPAPARTLEPGPADDGNCRGQCRHHARRARA